MNDTMMRDARPAKSSVLHEFFELLLNAFGGRDPVKNHWLMPFEPGPSSFKRDRRRSPCPKMHRRRPF